MTGRVLRAAILNGRCSAQCCMGHMAYSSQHPASLPHLTGYNCAHLTGYTCAPHFSTSLGTPVHLTSPPHWVPLCTDGLCAGLGGGQGRTFMQCLPVAHQLTSHLAPACCRLGGGQERALIQRLPVAHRLTPSPRSCMLQAVCRAGRWPRTRVDPTLAVACRLTSPPCSCMLHDVRRAGRWSRLHPATPFLMAMRSCTCSSGKGAGGGGGRREP